MQCMLPFEGIFRGSTQEIKERFGLYLDLYVKCKKELVVGERNMFKGRCVSSEIDLSVIGYKA